MRVGRIAVVVSVAAVLLVAFAVPAGASAPILFGVGLTYPTNGVGGDTLIAEPFDQPFEAGSVAYAMYSDAGCATQVADLGTAAVTADGVGGESAPTVAPSLTPYWVQGSYTDTVNAGGSSLSECTPLPQNYLPAGLGCFTNGLVFDQSGVDWHVSIVTCNVKTRTNARRSLTITRVQGTFTAKHGSDTVTGVVRATGHNSGGFLRDMGWTLRARTGTGAYQHVSGSFFLSVFTFEGDATFPSAGDTEFYSALSGCASCTG